MKNKKDIIKIIEQNGFIVKGKTCQKWELCYSVKSLNENYSISVSPLTIKRLNKSLLGTLTYWKSMVSTDTTPIKILKDIEKIISNIKNIIRQTGEINETK